MSEGETDSSLLLPLALGWRRDLVRFRRRLHDLDLPDLEFCPETETRVFYTPPNCTVRRATREAKRTRTSKADQQRYLSEFPSQLSLCNFSFAPRLLGGDNGRESERDASCAEQRKYDEQMADEEVASITIGLDPTLSLCMQTQCNLPGLQEEHRRRLKRGRDEETRFTPPTVLDQMWTGLDDDPMGVCHALGGRSSPATPPSLRSVHLTRKDTATRITKALSHIRVRARAREDNNNEDSHVLRNNLASHDVALSKGKKAMNCRPALLWSSDKKPVDEVQVRLPMQFIKNCSMVEAVQRVNENGYQNVQISEAEGVVESVSKMAFVRANRDQKTQYVLAKNLSKTRGKTIFLAVHPVGRYSAPTRNRVSEQQSGNHEQTESEKRVKDEVSVLVQPQKRSDGSDVGPKVLLNVPRSVAQGLKLGTTISFAVNGDMRYKVVDTKTHPPVQKQVEAESTMTQASIKPASTTVPKPKLMSTATVTSKEQWPTTKHSAMIKFNEQRAATIKVQEKWTTNKAVRKSEPSLATITRIQMPKRESPKFQQGSVLTPISAPNNKSVSAAVKTLMSRNFDVVRHQKPLTSNRQITKQSCISATTNAKRPKPFKVQSSISINPIARPKKVMAPCTPFCPGVGGVPEVECSVCRSLFHQQCLGLPVNYAVPLTFRCGMCQPSSSDHSKQQQQQRVTQGVPLSFTS